MSTQQGLSDEQVEELLNALLDFRQLLLGLTDRYQTRLSLLEQEFAERRAAPMGAAKGEPELNIRPSGPSPLAVQDLPDFEDEEEFFEPEAESFAIVDFEDDDDF